MWNKIQRIYVGQNLVRPKRQPTSHTLLYCPLNENINDVTWNHTMTSVTWTYGGVTKDSTGFYYFNWGYIKSESWTWPKQCTLSGWFNRATKSQTWAQGYALSMHFSTPEAQPYHTVAFNIGKTAAETAAIICPVSWSSYWSKISVKPSQPTIWTWTQWTMTYSSSDWLKLYVDWVLAGETSGGADIYQYNMPTEIWATANQYQYYQGYIAEVIYEDKVRTPLEVTMRYNQSKWRFI